MAKKINTPKKHSFLKYILVAVVAFLLGVIVWAAGNPKPVDNTASQNQVRKLVSFVDGAASLVETKKENAFNDFRQPNSQWWNKDQYVFVYDMDANTLVLPPTPEVEGTNRWNTTDDNGVYYVREMAKALANSNYAWVMYSYPKPGEQASSPKLAYVKKVNLGDKTVLVGSGIYY
jgi:cytochrome c